MIDIIEIKIGGQKILINMEKNDTGFINFGGRYGSIRINGISYAICSEIVPPKTVNEKNVSEKGIVLDEDYQLFWITPSTVMGETRLDTSFFKEADKELEKMDEQARMFGKGNIIIESQEEDDGN